VLLKLPPKGEWMAVDGNEERQIPDIRKGGNEKLPVNM